MKAKTVLQWYRKIAPTLLKYAKYNLGGVVVFCTGATVFWLLGTAGWFAYVMQGFIAGLVEFAIQLKYVYTEPKIFDRIFKFFERKIEARCTKEENQS
jgi:hypothetical protein